MTSSSLPSERVRRGFTLIELLVVIGIIVLLAAILIPAVNHAYKVAQRARMNADLQVISQALDAYRNDFGDYPRVSGVAFNPTGSGNPYSTTSGAAMLCWALIAPGPAGDGAGTPYGSDGADGPGFRIRGTTGRVWGPYLAPGRFRLAYAAPVKNGYVLTPATDLRDFENFLTDNYGNPIFYYPASKSVTPATGFVGKGPTFTFNFSDNLPGGITGPYAGLTCASQWTANLMRWRLGDTNANGLIDGAEVPAATGPYLLWSPGPDQQFGTDDDTVCNGTTVQINPAAPSPAALMKDKP